MAQILKNIYMDIYKAPRNSDKTLNEKIRQYRQKLGKGSDVDKKRIILVDPVNLMPIKAVPSKKTEGNYKLFNKLADSVPKAAYLELFKVKVSSVKKEAPKSKKIAVKKPCPPGTERNPKTGRCKKIVVKK